MLNVRRKSLAALAAIRRASAYLPTSKCIPANQQVHTCQPAHFAYCTMHLSCPTCTIVQWSGTHVRRLLVTKSSMSRTMRCMSSCRDLQGQVVRPFETFWAGRHCTEDVSSPCSFRFAIVYERRPLPTCATSVLPTQSSATGEPEVKTSFTYSTQTQTTTEALSSF